jgi:hypothetical protein
MAEETIVLSDASPLIGLAAIGCFEVLRGLFDTVHITESVRKEVTAQAVARCGRNDAGNQKSLDSAFARPTQRNGASDTRRR